MARIRASGFRLLSELHRNREHVRPGDLAILEAELDGYRMAFAEVALRPSAKHIRHVLRTVTIGASPSRHGDAVAAKLIPDLFGFRHSSRLLIHSGRTGAIMESNLYNVKSSHGGNMESAGARLKAERLRVGMSQQDLANHAGIHRQTQVNYERGPRPPPSDYLEAIGQIGLDVEYVVTGYRPAEGKQAHQAKNALLVMLLGALGYQDVEAHIREAVNIWNDAKPGPGMEGLAGRLVGDGPTVKLIRDSADNLDTDLLIEALSAAEEVLAKGSNETVTKRAILACELYRSAKRSGAIDHGLAKTLAALAD
ncbi:MAG: hypothetical protein A3E25_17835 [Burkholderiales bacterium RIFCSPHIGHO2_12_FULL_69_20]|nr:MAG: hypothetical protein A3E25_17835 [Burkholderiales bacterium RIFCSPHIGHO2_12_FULL_69_20]